MRDVLRQSPVAKSAGGLEQDAIRAGCAEAKLSQKPQDEAAPDAIRAGCAEAKALTAILF